MHSTGAGQADGLEVGRQQQRGHAVRGAVDPDQDEHGDRAGEQQAPGRYPAPASAGQPDRGTGEQSGQRHEQRLGVKLVGAAAHVGGGPEGEDQETEPAPGSPFPAPAHEARSGSRDQPGDEGQRNVEADEVLEVLGERTRRPEAKDLVEREREGQRPVRPVPHRVRHHLLVQGAGTGRDRKRCVERESKPGCRERERAYGPDPQRSFAGGERKRNSPRPGPRRARSPPARSRQAQRARRRPRSGARCRVRREGARRWPRRTRTAPGRWLPRRGWSPRAATWPPRR